MRTFLPSVSGLGETPPERGKHRLSRGAAGRLVGEEAPITGIAGCWARGVREMRGSASRHL